MKPKVAAFAGNFGGACPASSGAKDKAAAPPLPFGKGLSAADTPVIIFYGSGENAVIRNTRYSVTHKALLLRELLPYFHNPAHHCANL